MALTPISVGKDAQDVTTALARDTSWVFQNVSENVVEFCNHATDPTGEDVAWNILRYGEWVSVGKLLAGDDPLWVRTKSRHHVATLAVVLDNA